MNPAASSSISQEGKNALADLLNLNVKQASENEDLRVRYNTLVERNQSLEKQIQDLSNSLSKQASASQTTPVLDAARVSMAVDRMVEANITPSEKKAACRQDIMDDPNLAVEFLIKVASFVQPHLQAQGAAVPSTHLPGQPAIGHSRPTPWI